MAIQHMHDEVKTIRKRMRRLEDLDGSMDWEGAFSDIQQALLTIRQTTVTGLAVRSVLDSCARSNPPRRLAFRRGIFAGLDGGADSKDDQAAYLLSVIDGTLADVKDTLDAIRVSLAIHGSRQGISLATTMALLAELVFFFIPLSFSTSIFRMSIQVRLCVCARLP